MEFGTFNLMGYRQLGPTTGDLLRQCAEQTRLADEGGMEIAWFAEHHFSNYCVCPSPLMMAAYCAPQTKRIRLGTGVLVLPLYMPARLIAEIGMVDSLAEGRLVLGVGSGYQPSEFERFGIDLATSKGRTEELLNLIEKGLTEEYVAYDGAHYRLPRTHISARPHGGLPPIWITGESPQSQAFAAQRGYPIFINGRFNNADKLAARRPELERVVSEQGKDPSTLRWALLRFCCVTESKADALDYAENARYQLRLAGAERRGEVVVDGHVRDASKPAPNEPSIEEIAASQMIGDVETCIERGVEEIRKVRPSHIAMYFQLGSYDHKRAMRSLENFVGRVIPGIEKELGPLDQL
jgi:alkanesulfonate monooxygenase SsuD/methylene tetrahydromethanopterin reductase-like flavin-dependent oxidoreductase (luciferase family)